MSIKKKLAVLGAASLSLFSISTPALMQAKTQTVQAVNYKYADKFYKVKLLCRTEVDKNARPTLKVGDIFRHWKYLPAGTIVWVKSNGSNVSWQVKSPQLPGKYWVTEYNSLDYSWFSTNLNAELPRNTYVGHGYTVRQTPNTISLTNKYGKVTIYTNSIQLYHFPKSYGSTRNTAFIKAKFTNKSSYPRVAAHFVSNYFNIKKINENTLSRFDPSESTAHTPSEEIVHLNEISLSAVRPHKTITCLLADDMTGGLHSKQRFSFQPVDANGNNLGKPKYGTGSNLHYNDDDIDDDDDY